MKQNSEVRVCKNKKCQKPLPKGYKHKYCEACRNRQAQAAKNIGKGVDAGLGTAACFAIALLTKGRINPKGKD